MWEGGRVQWWNGAWLRGWDRGQGEDGDGHILVRNTWHRPGDVGRRAAEHGHAGKGEAGQGSVRGGSMQWWSGLWHGGWDQAMATFRNKYITWRRQRKVGGQRSMGRQAKVRQAGKGEFPPELTF